jgi:hypothetical protein
MTRMRISTKNSRAIVLAALVFVLGVFSEADWYRGAVHRGSGIRAASATAHAAGTRTRGSQRAVRGVLHEWQNTSSIASVTNSAVHQLTAAEFVFIAVAAARRDSSPHPSSARPPPVAGTVRVPRLRIS